RQADIGPHRAVSAGTYPFTVSNSFARFLDRTYSAEITRIGRAVRQPPASTHIVACTTCIAHALCSRQIFYHIRPFFASPFLKKIKLFLRSDADAPHRPAASLLYYKSGPRARVHFHV